MEKITQLIEWIDLNFNSLIARAILTKAREIEAEDIPFAKRIISGVDYGYTSPVVVEPVWTPTP